MLNMKKILSVLAVLMLAVSAASAQSPVTSFKVAALNVDGLPASVKVAGLYTVNLNPDSKGVDGAVAIGRKLATMGYDVIGVSEDFNFHDNIFGEISDAYDCGTYRGSIPTSPGLDFATKYLGKQSPLFQTDGLCLFARKTIGMENETCTAWNEHSGYDDNGADGLIDKGFRYYKITIDGVAVDLYILHMDAETTEGDIAARESQMAQLLQVIRDSDNMRPVIVMGDTNCRYTRDYLKRDFIDKLNADLRFTAHDAWVDQNYEGKYPTYGTGSMMVDAMGYEKGEIVDKIIFVNNKESDVQLRLKHFMVDTSFRNEAGEALADHFPVVAEFEVFRIQDFQDVLPEFPTVQYYVRNVATGKFLKAGGWWGSHAVVGDYGLPMSFTQLPNGKYEISSALGYIGKDAYMDAPGTEARAIKEWDLIRQGDYYVLAYNDGGQRALTANDPFYFSTAPNYRYVTSAALSRTSRYQQWELLTAEDLMKEAEGATASNPYNMTYLLPGANFDRNDGGNGKWAFTKPGNQVTQAIGGLDNHEQGNYNYAVSTSKPSGWFSSANNKWTVTQTVTGLRNGRYKVTFQGFYKEETQNGEHKALVTVGDKSLVLDNIYESGAGSSVSLFADAEENKDGVYYPTNQSAASAYFNKGLYRHVIEDVEVKDGTLTIKVEKTDNTKSYTTWTCFDNFQLFLVLPTTVIPFNVKESNGWSTLILPFESAIPEGMTVKTVEGAREDGLLLLADAGEIEANTPYVVYAENGIQTQFEGYMPEVTDAYYDDNRNMIGVLAPEGMVPAAGSYVLQNQSGVLGFYQIPEGWGQRVPQYHCYLYSSSSSVKAFFFNEEDATTIGQVTEVTEAPRGLYDLSGRRVQQLQRGIYIQHGRKVVR